MRRCVRLIGECPVSVRCSLRCSRSIAGDAATRSLLPMIGTLGTGSPVSSVGPMTSRTCGPSIATAPRIVSATNRRGGRCPGWASANGYAQQAANGDYPCLTTQPALFVGLWAMAAAGMCTLVGGAPHRATGRASAGSIGAGAAHVTAQCATEPLRVFADSTCI